MQTNPNTYYSSMQIVFKWNIQTIMEEKTIVTFSICQILGSLRYLVSCTMRYSFVCVVFLSMFMQNLSTTLWQALKCDTHTSWSTLGSRFSHLLEVLYNGGEKDKLDFIINQRNPWIGVATNLRHYQSAKSIDRCGAITFSVKEGLWIKT